MPTPSDGSDAPRVNRIWHAGLVLPQEIETPALVADLDRLEANIARMSRRATAGGVMLRPHAKTHKSMHVAALQLASGAAGMTVATLAEAELFADGGCDDLFIAYPVWAGGGRAPRVRALHERIRLRVGVDNVAAAETLARAVRGAATPLEVMIELDSGGKRTGVSLDRLRHLAEQCLELGLDVVGAFTHPGHAYAGRSAVVPAAEDEQRTLGAAGQILGRLLDEPPVLSGGSTPTASTDIDIAMTEMRPGTYVFGDRQQMTLSALPVGDVALVAVSRVVSTPPPDSAVLDAGSKTLSSDRPAWLDGFGYLPDTPEGCISSLSEEHAVVTGLRTDLRVGDLITIVPNHVCTAVHLAKSLVITRGGTVVDVWPVGSASLNEPTRTGLRGTRASSTSTPSGADSRTAGGLGLG